jgi:hypothetical protein
VLGRFAPGGEKQYQMPVESDGLWIVVRNVSYSGEWLGTGGMPVSYSGASTEDLGDAGRGRRGWLAGLEIETPSLLMMMVMIMMILCCPDLAQKLEGEPSG